MVAFFKVLGMSLVASILIKGHSTLGAHPKVLIGARCRTMIYNITMKGYPQENGGVEKHLLIYFYGF